MKELGGKQQLGLAENPLNNPRFNQYKKDLAALLPIDSAEKAAKYREIFEIAEKVKLTYTVEQNN